MLAGLEPVGTVPDLTTLRGSVAPNLYHLHASISSLLSHTFFITHRMKADLSVGRVNGTLPILYVFLARSGKTVREVTRVRLDEQGAVQPDVDGARGSATHGVKIVFAGSDDEPRTLYFFSTNLADDGVKNSKFLQFLETLAPGDGLVKSAYICCTRAASPRCATSCSPTPRRWSRTIPASRCATMIPRNGTCSRSGDISALSASSPAGISRITRRSSGTAAPSISA